eukprot:EG_transcript_54221
MSFCIVASNGLEEGYSMETPVDFKQTVELINRFVTATAQFMNRFATSCEQRLQETGRCLSRLEVSLLLLEAKLHGVEGLAVAPTPAAPSPPSAPPAPLSAALPPPLPPPPPLATGFGGAPP